VTPAEFKSGRRTLGLRQRDIAWMFGVLPRQVIRWEAGTSTVPTSVALLLSAYREGLITPRWLVEHLGAPA